jgi:hypothetical protein
MVEIFCFPLYRRQRLVRELERAINEQEVRCILNRIARQLDRRGISPTAINEQIGLLTRMVKQQTWTYGGGVG